MDDTQLLQEYVTGGSQQAFTRLVERHIHLVYASAWRQLRDKHLAEDVTQAVFIVLARKAASVRGGFALPGWLITTTRYAAANARNLEARRRHHEQKAAAMARTACDAAEVDDANESDRITPVIDAALARLSSADRSAVAMRYLQGKSLRDVGVAMGVSEEAAQKRVTRAIGKLRDFFAHRGIALQPAALAERLTAHTAQVAPSALAPAMVASTALSAAAKATATTSAGGTIAKGVVKAMTWAHAKLIAGAAASVVVVAGAGAVAVHSTRSQPSVREVAQNVAPNAPTEPGTPTGPPLAAEALWQPYIPNDAAGITPARFSNRLLGLGINGPCTFNIDPNVKRRPEEAAGLLQSTTAAKTNSIGVVGMIVIEPSLYTGKRIRLSAYLKTENVEQGASLILNVHDETGRLTVSDDATDRAVFGTHDWTRVACVADVPTNTGQIDFDVLLRGKGRVWIDQAQIDVVDKSVPTSDDHRWHTWTQTPAKYSVALDKVTKHDGHYTVCITSTTAQRGDWIWYGWNNRFPEAMLGKRVRMTAYVKSEGITAASGLQMRAVGSAKKMFVQDQTYGRRPVKGTTDWMKYSTIIDVPADAACLDSGFTIYGKGKLWFDEVTYEILEK